MNWIVGYSLESSENGVDIVRHNGQSGAKNIKTE